MAAVGAGAGWAAAPRLPALVNRNAAASSIFSMRTSTEARSSGSSSAGLSGRRAKRAPEAGRMIELVRNERGAYALQSGRGLSERGLR